MSGHADFFVNSSKSCIEKGKNSKVSIDLILTKKLSAALDWSAYFYFKSTQVWWKYKMTAPQLWPPSLLFSADE